MPRFTKLLVRYNHAAATLLSVFTRLTSGKHSYVVPRYHYTPDSKVHTANMGPTWVLSAPDGPHVGPMNLVIRDCGLRDVAPRCATLCFSAAMKHPCVTFWAHKPNHMSGQIRFLFIYVRFVRICQEGNSFLKAWYVKVTLYCVMSRYSRVCDSLLSRYWRCAKHRWISNMLKFEYRIHVFSCLIAFMPRWITL